jgi:hypothetical protein
MSILNGDERWRTEALLRCVAEVDELGVESAWHPLAAAGGRMLSVLAMAGSISAHRVQAQLTARGGALLRTQQQETARREATGAALAFAMQTVMRANEILLECGAVMHPLARSPFDCIDGRAPGITIGGYIERFIRYTPVCVEVLIATIGYIDRFMRFNLGGVYLLPSNVHRLFAAAFVVASKFVSDVYYSNKYYAKIAGISLNELNSLERIFLGQVSYSLYIEAAEYDAYARSTEVLAALLLPSATSSSTPSPPPTTTSPTSTAPIIGDLGSIISAIIKDLRAHVATTKTTQS